MSTLGALLDRDDLQEPLRTRVRSIAGLMAAIVDQFDRVGRTAEALQAIDKALTRLGPLTSEPEQLAVLWLQKPRLQRLSGSPSTALTSSEEIIDAVSGRATEASRQAIISANLEKASALSDQGHTREGLTICGEIIDAYRDCDDINLRERVAAAMATKAHLQRQRRRHRTALRTLRQLSDYCGDPPAPPLQRWAQHAHDRSMSIATALADRRRLRTVTLGLLALINAPSFARAARSLQHRRQPRRTSA
jgi:hypothetical protein